MSEVVFARDSRSHNAVARPWRDRACRDQHGRESKCANGALEEVGGDSLEQNDFGLDVAEEKRVGLRRRGQLRRRLRRHQEGSASQGG